MDVIEAQKKLLKLEFKVQEISHELFTLAEGLPRPANQDEMFECKIPLDLVSGIYAKIEFVRESPLREVIEDLNDAATLTAEKLDRRFRKLQEQEAGGNPAGAAPALCASSAPSNDSSV